MNLGIRLSGHTGLAIWYCLLGALSQPLLIFSFLVCSSFVVPYMFHAFVDPLS